MSGFDPNMTYWQSLRIVVRGLIQWPIHHYEWKSFIEGVKDVLYYGLAPFVRLIILILLPISAPLITWLVQVERRKKEAARKAAKERIRSHYQPVPRQSADNGEQA